MNYLELEEPTASEGITNKVFSPTDIHTQT